MPAESDHPLPVVRVGEIPEEDTTCRWLVDQLWGDSSVGVIGGAPKCSKTWLGLDLALSVATGTACLGTYAVPQAGPVLVYLAEDALPIVRERVAGMARHRGLDLHHVEIHVITAPTLRLDRQPHRTRLLETAKRLRPRLLLKLEMMLEKVNAAGYRCDTFQVMSGYRTPHYNMAIGNVKYSRHVWGGAADIFVDGVGYAYRMRIRAPGFANVQAMPLMAVGETIADLIAIIGSVDYILPDIDR